MSPIVGTAGWSIPREDRPEFPGDGSVLQRYAQRFGGVEINSSFYRPHRQSTWARWEESVPADFRFAVKIPRTITHERGLVDCAAPLAEFINQVSALGPKLAVLLLQLPPKLDFEPAIAADFLEMLTRSTAARIACEPRHPGWFAEAPDELLDRLGVARVAADPARVPAAALPGGWRGLGYWRLHGSPRIYRSAYGPDRLADYAAQLRAKAAAWCIFDNTAASAATGDALAMTALL